LDAALLFSRDLDLIILFDKMKKYILALDQGTTSSRAILFDKKGKIKGQEQAEFTQFFPKPGWVEHDAKEILKSQLQVARDVLRKNKVNASEIDSIGITNQRETTVVWDVETGEPVSRAIVWQDRRTAKICRQMKKAGLERYIRSNTGLVLDAYFSGTKIKWILDHTSGLRAKAKKGQVKCGTIDTWLLWHLTKGKEHATDFSNASRTLIYNIKKLCWDKKIIDYLKIPKVMLPQVKNSSGAFGHTDASIFGAEIPITGIAGDQQAALFGQTCFDKGMAKNTYGTGCFMLMNTGETAVSSKNGLLTTIAWGLDGKITYALEGSVFIAGAAIQWLRDGLKILDHAADSEYFAKTVDDSGGVYVVPAFTGLGAPYWNMEATGAIYGLTRGVNKNHIIRATLESLAYQSKDVLSAMEKDSKIKLAKLKVDGGASANEFLMQFQADVLGVGVERHAVVETTALGAAYLAGLHTGFYIRSKLVGHQKGNSNFKPEIEEKERKQLYQGWKKAVKKTLM